LPAASIVVLLPPRTVVKRATGIGPGVSSTWVTTGGWRLAFQIKRARGKPLELRAYLQNGKDVLTETWTYQLES